MALGVRHDLKLNVPGVQYQLFQVHLPVSEAGHRLSLGLLEPGLQLSGGIHLAHAPASASGGGLQQHGVAHLLRQRLGLTGVLHRAVRPGHHRHPGLLRQSPGGRLAAQLPDHVPGGSHILQPRLDAPVGKVRVFRQKAVAGMDGVAAGSQGGGEDGILIQVAVRRPSRADAQGTGGQLGVEGALIRLGPDGHRLHPQLPAGPDDPQGDLPPVGNQHTLQHCLTPSGCGTAGRPPPPPRRPSPGLPR